VLIPMLASPIPGRGVQEPFAWVGQSRSVVQMMALLAPVQTAVGWQATDMAAYSMQQTDPPSQSEGRVHIGVIGGGFSHWSRVKSSGRTQLKYGAIFWAQQTVDIWQTPAVPHIRGPSDPASL
jgi:hypothetical protein